MTQIELLRREIVHLNLKTKELIQEIQNCKGPIEVLNDLNYDGRKKISLLRNNINLLKTLVYEEVKPNIQKLLLGDVKESENELAATMAAFKKANFAALLAIDQTNRNELLNEIEDSLLKHRNKKGKENLIKLSTNVTDQLVSISRSLCDSMQRSASTLDTLVNSSTTADGTQGELGIAGNVIAQSGKLLAKYGRREKTDKVLVFFAFIFFLACVFYVIQKRNDNLNKDLKVPKVEEHIKALRRKYRERLQDHNNTEIKGLNNPPPLRRLCRRKVTDFLQET